MPPEARDTHYRRPDSNSPKKREISLLGLVLPFLAGAVFALPPSPAHAEVFIALLDTGVNTASLPTYAPLPPEDGILLMTMRILMTPALTVMALRWPRSLLTKYQAPVSS